MGDDSMALGYALGQDSNNGCNGNSGFGWGGEWFWAIIILAMFWGNNGWGGFGGGGNNGGGYVATAATQSDIQRGFDTQSIIGKLDGISNGLCDGFYAMNTSMLQGFNGVNSAICNLGYQTQNGFNATQVAMMQGFNGVQAGQNALGTQLAQCCCDTQRQIERGFADTNYNMATNTCAIQTSLANNTRDIIDSQNAGTRAILDYLCKEKIADLQSENQTLKFQASQANQNAFIQANQDAQTAELIRRLGRDCPVPAYVVPNPNCCYGTPYGVYPNNSGCGYSGCNSGCCGCNG